MKFTGNLYVMEPKKEKLSLKDTAVDFCETTTIHGLFFLSRLGHKWYQLFWTLVVFSGFVGLSYHLWRIVFAFLEYKTTEYSYEQDNGFLFPDVTICNLNGLSQTNIQDASSRHEEVQYFLNMSERNVTLQVDDPVSSTNLFWSLGDHAADVGHQLSDFVIRCRFEDSPCDEKEDFLLYPFATFFNCYTFAISRTGRRVITQGIAAGLTLTLFLEPMNRTFVKPYGDNAFTVNMHGVRVLLTPPGSLPAAGVMGHDILPGQATYLAFEITERVRLPEPYTTCRGVDSMPIGDNFTYSFTECKNICLHNLIIKTCGCFPTTYKVRRNYTKDNIPSCGHNLFTSPNVTQTECQRKILQNIETRLNYANDCNCHAPCGDTKYSITTGHSEFPSDNSMFSFWNTVLEDHPQKEELKAYKYYKDLQELNTTTEDMFQWTKKHFLRLTVYASTKTVTVKEQIPMITPIDLMSQIGGCLGLWVGISIITVVELLDLVIKLFYVVLKRLTDSEIKAESPGKINVNNNGRI